MNPIATWFIRFLLFIIASLLLLLAIAHFAQMREARHQSSATAALPPPAFIIEAEAAPTTVATATTVKPTFLFEKADMDFYVKEAKNRDVHERYERVIHLYPELKKRRDRTRTTTTQPLANHEEENDMVLAAVLEEIARPHSQTVHDTAVQETVKIYMKETASPSPTSNDLQRIQAEILAYTSQHKPQAVSDVSFVLKKILKRDSSLYNIKSNETDVLARVWSSPSDNVKRQVINELVDCKKSENEIYCPTGVVTRLVNAGLIETPEAMPRTKETLRAEMLLKASDTRERLEANPDFKALPEEAQSARLKQELIQRYETDYAGVVSADVLKQEYTAWIDTV